MIRLSYLIIEFTILAHIDINCNHNIPIIINNV